MLKLNLGCGNDIRDGYVNIDIRNELNNSVLVGDITNLQYAENSVDEILALDVYEHISHRRSLHVLQHWSDILKPSGKLILRSPSLDVIIEKYYNTAKTASQIKRVIEIIFGGQDYPENSHFTICHPIIMKEYLTKCGFVDLSFSYINQNIQIECRKKE